MDLSSKFAIATSAAKKQGYHSFQKGSPGYDKRKAIAEAIARRVKGK